MNPTEKTGSDEQSRRWHPHLAQYEKLLEGLQAVAGRRQFISWVLVQVHGRAKPSKIPYTRDGEPLKGSFSDPALSANLMTLEEAIAAAKARGHDGVGLVFTPGCGIVGIDLDCCIVDGEVVGTSEQQQALAAFAPYSFIEHSQSGKGLHAIALGDAVTNKMDGVLELFGNKNFLALTGLNGRGIAAVISTTAIDRVEELVCQLKGTTRRSYILDPELNSDLTAHLKAPVGQLSVDAMRSVLRYLDPSCDRDTWMRVLWGIHHGLGDTPEARELADQWSKGELNA